jgi:hypothetical protein
MKSKVPCPGPPRHAPPHRAAPRHSPRLRVNEEHPEQLLGAEPALLRDVGEVHRSEGEVGDGQRELLELGLALGLVAVWGG